MDNGLLTARQREFWREFRKYHKLSILTGAVRSGKTYISLVAFLMFVLSRPRGGGDNFLMVGRTIESLKHNCLTLAAELAGDSFKVGSKSAWYKGREIWLAGANDERAEGRIRGVTLAGAYVDEATLIPRGYFKMLMTRLSLPYSRLIATTNPDHPGHWLKTEYIDNDTISRAVHTFSLEDNTTLDPSVIENLRLENAGAFYDRFIRGLWTAPEGAIYKSFAGDRERFIVDFLPQDILRVNIGVDFGGNKSASAFVAVGISRDYRRVYVVDEEYRPAASENPDSLARAFVAFCQRVKAAYPAALDAYCDSAEQVLIRGLRNAILAARVAINVKPSRKTPIIDRIRAVTALMEQDRFAVSAKCVKLIAALAGSVWDSQSSQDKRLDNGSNNQDSIDAFEYALEGEFTRLGVMAANEPTGISQIGWL